MRRALLGLVLGTVLVGCSGPDNGPPPPQPPSQAEMDAAIQKIQSNPSMSQADKDRVIAGMKSAASQMGKRVGK